MGFVTGVLKVASFPAEYALKVASVPVAITAAGSESNGVIPRAADGFDNTWDAITSTYRVGEMLATVSIDFKTLTGEQLYDKYGSNIVGSVVETANELSALVMGIKHNFFDGLDMDSAEALTAAGINFLLLYGGSRAMKFMRQKGQGSALDKLERHAGNKVYNLDEKVAE